MLPGLRGEGRESKAQLTTQAGSELARFPSLPLSSPELVILSDGLSPSNELSCDYLEAFSAMTSSQANLGVQELSMSLSFTYTFHTREPLLQVYIFGFLESKG